MVYSSGTWRKAPDWGESVSIKMTKAVTLVTLNPPTADYHAARLHMPAIALQNHFTVAHIYGLCLKT